MFYQRGFPRYKTSFFLVILGPGSLARHDIDSMIIIADDHVPVNPWLTSLVKTLHMDFIFYNNAGFGCSKQDHRKNLGSLTVFKILKSVYSLTMLVPVNCNVKLAAKLLFNKRKKKSLVNDSGFVFTGFRTTGPEIPKRFVRKHINTYHVCAMQYVLCTQILHWHRDIFYLR